METTIITASQLILAPVVMGVVSAIKATGLLADRYAPLTAIAVGIASAFVFPGVSIGLTVLAGVVIGLMSSGLYSGGKATFQSSGVGSEV